MADFIAEFTYDEELVLETPKLLPPADPSTSNVVTSMSLVPELPIWGPQTYKDLGKSGSHHY